MPRPQAARAAPSWSSSRSAMVPASPNNRSASPNSPVQNAASINASSAAAQRSPAPRPGPFVICDSVFAGVGQPSLEGACRTGGPLPPEDPQALAQDAGPEGGGGATDDSLGDGVLVLVAELPGRRYDRVRRRVKSLGKGPRAARGIVGTPDDSGGYGHWRCGDGDGVGPESTRLLHLQLLSRGLPETTRLVRNYRAARCAERSRKSAVFGLDPVRGSCWARSSSATCARPGTRRTPAPPPAARSAAPPRPRTR